MFVLWYENYDGWWWVAFCCDCVLMLWFVGCRCVCVSYSLLNISYMCQQLTVCFNIIVFVFCFVYIWMLLALLWLNSYWCSFFIRVSFHCVCVCANIFHTTICCCPFHLMKKFIRMVIYLSYAKSEQRISFEKRKMLGFQ